MKNFVERFKLLRNEKHISYQGLADVIHVSVRALKYYGTGEREPTLSVLISLANFFDVSLDYLADRSDDSTPLSYHSEWEKTFRERLGELLPSLDRTNLQDAGISVNYLESIAFEDFPLTFHTACDIADELGESLDYLTGRTDKREVNR